MNYWHMQLHPNDYEGFTEDHVWDIIWETKTVGMGTAWKNDKGIPDIFRNEMKIGDVILIRPMYALVKVTSDWYELDSSQVNHDLDWYQLRRDIQFLSENYPENYEEFRDSIYAPTTLSIIKPSNIEAYKYIDDWYKSL